MFIEDLQIEHVKASFEKNCFICGGDLAENGFQLIIKCWYGIFICGVRAMLAQLVRSLTANRKVPGSIPGLVEGWTWVTFFHHTVRGQGR